MSDADRGTPPDLDPPALWWRIAEVRQASKGRACRRTVLAAVREAEILLDACPGRPDREPALVIVRDRLDRLERALAVLPRAPRRPRRAGRGPSLEALTERYHGPLGSFGP